MTSKKSDRKIADTEPTLPAADTVPSPEESLSLDACENFFNRELGQLQFNHRVLKQALDNTHPLINRLTFCCIFSSNMDEFFEIRVAGMRQ